MRKIIPALTLAVLAVTLPLAAQTDHPFKLSVGGGVGLPLGDFDNGFKLGWHGSVAGSYLLADAPIAFQVEAAFSQFPDDQAAVDLKQNLFYGTGDLVFHIRLSGVRSVLPYLIGGGGLYYINPAGPDGAGLESRTKFGLNLGGGLEFNAGQTKVFLESRFYDAFDGLGTQDLQFNNVTGGIRFGID